MTGEQEMSTKNVCFSPVLELTGVAPVCERGTLPAKFAKFDLSTEDTFFAYMSTGKEQKRKHTQAITKMVKKTLSCAFTPGALAAASCSELFLHSFSSSSSHILLSVEQTAGHLEWETRRRRHRGVLQCPCEGILCIYTVYQ